MATARAIKRSMVTGLVSAATLALLICVMLAFTMPIAHTTPEIGKGQPCTNCHTGMPPTKDNATKK